MNHGETIVCCFALMTAAFAAVFDSYLRMIILGIALFMLFTMVCERYWPSPARPVRELAKGWQIERAELSISPIRIYADCNPEFEKKLNKVMALLAVKARETILSTRGEIVVLELGEYHFTDYEKGFIQLWLRSQAYVVTSILGDTIHLKV